MGTNIRNESLVVTRGGYSQPRPFWRASRVSWYWTVLQRVQIRDGRRVLFVWVWTRIWCVIFHFPRSSSGPPVLRLLYPRRQFAVILFAWKSGPVAFEQSPSNVMPHLMAVSYLPASLPTAGTWIVPRYAAYFQFIADGNEQYAVLNIPSAKEMPSAKKTALRRDENLRTADPKTTTVPQSRHGLMR